MLPFAHAEMISKMGNFSMRKNVLNNVRCCFLFLNLIKKSLFRMCKFTYLSRLTKSINLIRNNVYFYVVLFFSSFSF